MARTPRAKPRPRTKAAPRPEPQPTTQEEEAALVGALRSLYVGTNAAATLAEELQELASKDVTPDADRDVKLRQLSDYAQKHRNAAFECGFALLEHMVQSQTDPLLLLERARTRLRECSQGPALIVPPSAL